MAAPAWVPKVLEALHIQTREELDDVRGARRILEAVEKAGGWEVEPAPHYERGFLIWSPGAKRRWTLGLPVYTAAKREDGDYEVHGIRFKGGLACGADAAREAFMRQQLKGGLTRV